MECVSSCIFFLCLFSQIITSVSQTVDLRAGRDLVTSCGENLTLTCEARSSRALTIKTFSWLHRNKILCEVMPGVPKLEGECTIGPGDKLSLTLNNVMPVHAGAYLCKISTTMGMNSSTTVVTVRDCLERNTSHINESVATCSFEGVYPPGVVHWSQGDANLTEFSRKEDTVEADGRHQVWSMIDVRNRKVNESYQCCLWNLSAGEKLACQTLKSTGHFRKLHWIYTAVGILVVKLLM